MLLAETYLVIVLYNKSLKESKTIQSLSEILTVPVSILVYDNSPYRQYPSADFNINNFNIHYFHDQTNSGLNKAYNLAIKYAQELNLSWLLLLDQDTSFTQSYIKEISNLDINRISTNVVAFIPTVKSSLNEFIISPSRILLGGLCRPIKVQSGILNTKITAINSGTILNISYMMSIYGFSQKYILDMLDHWYFREIFKSNKEVFLLNSSIYQDLSVVGNFEENVSLLRYQQMLYSEILYISEEGMLSLFVFKLRLIFRIIKQVNFNNKNYYKLTLKYLFRKL